MMSGYGLLLEMLQKRENEGLGVGQHRKRVRDLALECQMLGSEAEAWMYG